MTDEALPDLSAVVAGQLGFSRVDPIEKGTLNEPEGSDPPQNTTTDAHEEGLSKKKRKKKPKKKSSAERRSVSNEGMELQETDAGRRSGSDSGMQPEQPTLSSRMNKRKACP